jgi:hypothetical protein
MPLRFGFNIPQKAASYKRKRESHPFKGGFLFWGRK